MFDKKYILWELYSIVCLYIADKEERIQFWLEYFESWYFEDIHHLINATRELERLQKFYIEEFNKRKKKKSE